MSEKESPENRAEREAAAAAERAKAPKPDAPDKSFEDTKADVKTAQASGFQIGKQVYFNNDEGRFVGAITRMSDSTVHVRMLDGDEKEFNNDAVELV